MKMVKKIVIKWSTDKKEFLRKEKDFFGFVKINMDMSVHKNY